LQQLIRTMAVETSPGVKRRIANELKLKLGIRVAPSTVLKYMGRKNRHSPDPTQQWLTFMRNHAQIIVATDFFTVVTAQFRILYIFIVMELGRRQILHCGVTDHPTAEWTLQQFREPLPGSHPDRFACMIETASTLGSWTRRWPLWECGFYVPRFGRPKPIPGVNGWWAPYTGSAWFSHSAGTRTPEARFEHLGHALQPK
jgi:hypothetical protein